MTLYCAALGSEGSISNPLIGLNLSPALCWDLTERVLLALNRWNNLKLMVEVAETCIEPVEID